MSGTGHSSVGVAIPATRLLWRPGQGVKTKVIMKTKNRVTRQQRRERNRNRINRYKKAAGVNVDPLFILVLIKLGLNKLYTPELLLAQLRLHILKLTGNVNFSTTDPTVAKLQTWADNLQAAIDAVKAGDHSVIEHRDTLVEESKELIRQLSYDIQFQSHGDAEKITSAGFEVRKPRTAPQLPVQMQNLRAKALGNGKIQLRWKAIKNSDLYVILESTDLSGDNWKPATKSTKVNVVLEDLRGGTTYYYKVYAINSKGDGNPSDVVEQMCLS
jgi:hypothetical protein